MSTTCACKYYILERHKGIIAFLRLHLSQTIITRFIPRLLNHKENSNRQLFSYEFKITNLRNTGTYEMASVANNKSVAFESISNVRCSLFYNTRSTATWAKFKLVLYFNDPHKIGHLRTSVGPLTTWGRLNYPISYISKSP